MNDDLHVQGISPMALRNGVALGVVAWCVLIAGVACAVRLIAG